MRNTLVYPVTKQEIIDCLDRIFSELAYEDEKEPRCGDMRQWLLAEAIDIVKSSNYNENPGPIENSACNASEPVT